MKKTLVVASIAGACALAFNAYADAETPPRYLGWFQGVGAATEGEVDESSDLAPSGGSWTLGTGTKSYAAEMGFSYDLNAGQTVTFNASQEAAPATDTVTRVELVSYFSPVICSESLDIAAPDGASTQVGFVSAAITNASGEATMKYCAWTGNGWFALDGAAPNADEDVLTTLNAEFDYRDAAPIVSFTIVSNDVTYPLTTGTVETVSKFGIASSSASVKKVNGLVCSGSGNVKSLTGEIAEAIAEMDGKKYISLHEAVDAISSATDKNITMLAATPENVELTDGAAITNASGYVTGEITAGAGANVTIELSANDINNGANGEYEVPVKTATAGGTVTIALPFDNKEIARDENGVQLATLGNTIKVTVQTATSVLQAVKPDSANADTALKNIDGKTNNVLRVFLEKYAKTAYEATDANASDIAEALNNSGVNGLKLWQDYVLGIEPTTDIKPVTAVAGDSDGSNISLEIPALAVDNTTGDYTVSYKVYKDDSETPLDVEQSAGAIKIPTSGGTATYTVKAVLTPAP